MRVFILTILLFCAALPATAQSDDWLAGKWKAWRELPGQSDFEYLELYANHTGYKAQGGIENGQEILLPYLLLDLKRWELKNDTLRCFTKRAWNAAEGAYTSQTLEYVIKEKSEGKFTAVFVDPNAEPVPENAPAEFQPIPLRFLRSE